MNARKKLCAALVALVPLCSATLVVAPAQAQDRYVRDESRGPVIRGFNVDEVRRLAPGVELNFDLYGTPGGDATLRIEGADRNLHMTETQPGQYHGTYTIGSRDRIRAESSVTASLRWGNMVATNVLAESLIRDGGRVDEHRGQLAAVPRIERFGVRGNDDIRPGNELTFTVRGTPGAKVSIAIAGARGMFFLPEVRPGEYSGVYTVRREDRLAPDSQVTATIRDHGRYSSAILGEPLLAGGRWQDGRDRDVRDARDYRGDQRDNRYVQDNRACADCATVTAVNVVEANGNRTGLGALGGAVVGGLLGSSVGSGSGRTAATVAGAVGGAVVGNNIEGNGGRRDLNYEVVVRYANGATQTMNYDNDPGFRVGDQVRVESGHIVRN
jgi:outer membrane lipoprotein SlyB